MKSLLVLLLAFQVTMTNVPMRKVTPRPRPALTVNPGVLDFHYVEVGATKEADIVVANVGSAIMDISQFEIRGADVYDTDEGMMLLRNNCPKKGLAPSVSCVLTVGFKPSRTGSASAVILFYTDAGLWQETVTGIGVVRVPKAKP